MKPVPAPESSFFHDVRGILASALTAEFGIGFGYASLRNFRQFYLTYPGEEEICYTLRSKLSWSHNRLIMREKDTETPEGQSSSMHTSSAIQNSPSLSPFLISQS